MKKDFLWPDFWPYTAVVEDPDGRTFEQSFTDYSELVDLIQSIYGDGYRIVTVY